MLRAAVIPERTGAEGGPLSAELQGAVRAELETMLAASIFVQSSRCKRFLSYIVDQTLLGNGSQLKERTVGIAVFERRNDYDTGDDSIVRVTANEVRKRISQFYRESLQPHLIQIELPRGSYVPEFRIQPTRRAETPIEPTPPHQAEAEPSMGASSIAEQPLSAFPIGLEVGVDRESTGNVNASSNRIKLRKRMIYSTVLFLLIASAALWKERGAKPTPDLWSAFLGAKAPILVCIDTHNLEPFTPDQSANGQRFVDLVLRRQIISLDDAAILSSMTSELGKKGIPFRVIGAEQTSLADLRRQPVILIGAIDNRWTIRLSENLPYRIEVVNPPGSGTGKAPVASIVDSAHPASARWVTDLSVPFTTWKSDYAIVARIDDATTGVPVLIEAGLGNDGTVAAGEWITTGSAATALAHEASCRAKRNFEAVLETQIIDTKSGPPHVLRLTCW